MTPYELNLFIETWIQKENSRQQEHIIMAWLSEYYHRQKRLPSLKKALEEWFGEEKKIMSDEEMEKMVEKLNAKLKGNLEKKSGD